MSTHRIKMALEALRSRLPWRKILIGVVLLLFVGGCWAIFLLSNGYITQTKSQIQSLRAEQTKLRDAAAKQQIAYDTLQKQTADDKKTLEDALKTSQDKITALEGKVAELEKKVSANRLPAGVNPAKTNSVYDRIISDNAEAKQKLIDAIKLVESATPSYFKIIQDHVQEIHATTNIGCGGGQQIKRTIYISYTSGTCLSNTPTSTFASVVIHESYHVYNVYVNKVITSGKEQELPSLYVQRATFDALGVVQSFRDYIESIIAYYEAH